MNDGGLAISLGENAETRIGGMLEAEAATPPPFMSVSMDAARYYAFMGEAIAAGEAGGDDMPSPEMQAALTDMMDAIAELYDRMWIDVVFTGNGIEMHTVETLK
jgi:endo-beta-N-acetylglucosaminidase D